MLAYSASALVVGAGVAWGTGVERLTRFASRLLPPAGPKTLPDLSYPIIDGRRIGPEQLAGRVTLVSFWATSCGICVAEMPDLVALHSSYARRGFELLAIAMPYDRPDHVLDFARRRALPFPVALDPTGAAVAAWGGILGTPTAWLVAPDGRVVAQWIGRLDIARVRARIESLLPRPAV